MKVGDEAIFNPDSRWEEWKFTPESGERVKILAVYARVDGYGKVDGELVDIVSIDTGALYSRVGVEWFEGEDESF